MRKHVRRRDAARDEKTRALKKGRSRDAEAAKFREETPKKGGGFAGGPAIPRCNNMLEPNLARKAEIGAAIHFILLEQVISQELCRVLRQPPTIAAIVRRKNKRNLTVPAPSRAGVMRPSPARNKRVARVGYLAPVRPPGKWSG